MASEQADCVFCKMIAGQMEVKAVYDGGDTFFFHDHAPKAKVHIIGIPKKHISSLHHMIPDDQTIVGKLLHDVAHVADEAGLAQDGYRVITNIGSNAGQAVRHLHFHILGGERLGPLNA